MKRVLVINPNTSASVTDAVLTACRSAHPALEWHGVSARFGAPYIADEIAYAVAAHAVLDAHAVHFDGHDAVLIACFGDPGLLALRELAGVPVLGLAQASLAAAASAAAATPGGRFAVVTGGHAWGPMLARFARAQQLDAGLCGIHTVDLTGGQIAAAPSAALDSLAAAAQQGIDGGAGCILLGGAALAGLAARLQPRVGVPVLDNVLLAARAVADAPTSRARHAAAPAWFASFLPVPPRSVTEDAT